MADDPNADDQGQEAEEPGWAKALRKKLEASEKRNAELESQLATRDREALFDKVGIPKTGAGALLRQSYDGDLTEDALRAKALEFEVIKQESATPPDERDAISRMGEVLHGQGSTQDYAKSVLDQAMADVNASDGSPEALGEILRRYNLSAEGAQ